MPQGPCREWVRRLQRGSRARSLTEVFISVGEPKGCRGRAESPLLVSLSDNSAVRNVPPEGLTRRLRRGWWGCRPEGGSTFFRSERKYQRKHAARRLREKGFYCPFCQRDSQRRARHSWRVISCSRARSCARLFPPSKWAGLFPSAAYRRSAPPQLALGRLK